MVANYHPNFVKLWYFTIQIGQRGDIEYGDVGFPGLPGKDGAPAPYGEKGTVHLFITLST